MDTKAKKTIFVVDDDPDNLLVMSTILDNMGFDVITADGQKEGEKMLETIKPDLAIFDLMMENKDSGFILSYRFKQIFPNIPVIIATALTAETGMVFGLENEIDKKWIKADLYLEKGIRPDQLHREIHKLLKL